MTHTYSVSGLTWSGCNASTRLSLFNISKDRTDAFQHKEKQLRVSKELSIKEKDLKKVLSNKQSQNKGKPNSTSTSTEDEVGKRDLKQLFPLFLISNYILITSLLLNMKSWDVSSFMLDFIGLFYIVFSFCKLFDLKGFPQSFRLYDPLAKAVPAYAWVYPFIEVALGVLLLMRFQINIVLIIMLVILSITTCGVVKALFNKKTIQCACLGTAIELPMTKATFIKNTVMIVMMVIMLFKSVTL